MPISVFGHCSHVPQPGQTKFASFPFTTWNFGQIGPQGAEQLATMSGNPGFDRSLARSIQWICEILTSFSATIFGGAKFMKHQVLYIKKNLSHSAITTSKDIKIRQPGPELEGVSKSPRTCGHPVDICSTWDLGSLILVNGSLLSWWFGQSDFVQLTICSVKFVQLTLFKEWLLQWPATMEMLSFNLPSSGSQKRVLFRKIT